MNDTQIQNLRTDFNKQYSNFNNWVFESDFHSGCFGYFKDNMAVYFTPEWSKDRQVAIQLTTLEGEIVYSEDILFPFHEDSISAKQLFLIVFRYLTKIDKDPKIFGTFER